MKRDIVGGLIALVLAVVIVLILGVGLPTRQALEAEVAEMDGGQMLLVENTEESSRIYITQGTGRVDGMYEERRVDGELVTAITQVYWAEEIFFLRESYIEGHYAPYAWSLYRKPTGEAAVLLGSSEDDIGLHIRPTDIAVNYGNAQVAGVTDQGAAVLLSIPTSGGTWSVEGGSTPRRIIDVGIHEGTVFALSQNGDLLRISGDSAIAATEADVPGAEIPEEISAGFIVFFQCKAPYIFEAIFVVVLLFAVYFLLRLGNRSKTLAMRTSFVAGGALLAMLVVLASSFYFVSIAFQRTAAMTYASNAVEERASLLAQYAPESVLQPDFYDSEAETYLAAGLADGDVLVALHPEGNYIAMSEQYVMGTKPEDTLPALELELVNDAALLVTASEMVYESGRLTGYIATPVYASGVPVGILLSKSVLDFAEAPATTTLLLIAAMLLTLFLLGFVAVFVFLRHQTKPIQSLSRQMRAVSDGDLTVQPPEERPDELGEMDRAMQEMCMGLAIRDYEVNAVLQSYARFIPSGLENLLDRASVMEVGRGDAKTLTGPIGFFSVQNRGRARQQMEDDAFVDFVNLSFSQIRRNTDRYDGRLLYGGFDLGAVPVLYRTAHDGLGAGLDLMGEWRREQDEERQPEYFLMLHHTSTLYGIAGTEEHVFPFLSSAEIEFLGSFAPRFQAAGVHMVMTESFRRELSTNCTTRYIGFVRSGDGKYIFKLYEAMDTYSDMERNLRVRYDGRLQEAIQLFYHNDFYLARNIFSSLLKACPRDGIVRWYLFACEYFFHSRPDQVNSQLFGIDENER